MKYNLIIFPINPLSLLFLCVILFQTPGAALENAALGMRISGPLENSVRATNGVVAGDDYAVIVADDPSKAVLVIDLQGPVFTDRLEIFWNKGIEQLKRSYSTSIDIFSYEETGAGTIDTYEGGLMREEIRFSPRMVRYVQIDLSMNPVITGLRLHEFQLVKKRVEKIVFTGVHAENITEHSADICWNTDIATVTKIKYGSDQTKMEKMVTQINVDSEHRVQLTGLKKGTVYYYQIVVDDINPEPFSAEIGEFKTAGIPLPLFSAFSADAGQESIVFSWGTNVGTRAVFELGDSVELKVKYPLGDEIRETQSVTVGNLLPGTLYRYKLTCVDTFKNGITTGARTIRTSERNVALGKPVEGTFSARPDNYITTEPPIIARVTDGSTSYFKGMATSGNILRDDQWIIIDLEEPVALDLVSLYWRQNAHSRDFSLSGSNDKNSFEIVSEHLDAAVSSDRTTSESGDPVLKLSVPCNGVKYRYIKIEVKKGSKFYNKHAGRQNFVQLMEVKAFPVIKYRFKPEVCSTPLK